MLVKLFCTALASLALLFCSGHADAQIVRVASGVSEGGVTNYIEVFEYGYVSEKPSFPGGEAKLTEFINNNRQYPKEAYDRGIQGRVTCQFVVNADGSVSNISLVRSVNNLLNDEAIRIFSLMPQWIPGRIDGIAVPVRVIRSVRFKK